MGYDKALIAGKSRRWEKYLERFRLPAWDDIPDFGLYMEQTVHLLKQYLDYMPPELKEEQIITAATINNYVRTRVMPEPIKKKYYRRQYRVSYHDMHTQAESQHCDGAEADPDGLVL